MKAKLDAIWRAKGVYNSGNVTIWHETTLGLEPCQGEERAPTVGKSAQAFMRRVRKHWGPEPMTYCGYAKMIMPVWLRENYKRNCPNNYKTLIAEYGKGVTKLDRVDEQEGLTI
jgi:GH25 family lysozyme M1 (1,4-beta-N-acetylmuramidase)